MSDIFSASAVELTGLARRGTSVISIVEEDGPSYDLLATGLAVDFEDPIDFQLVPPAEEGGNPRVILVGVLYDPENELEDGKSLPFRISIRSLIGDNIEDLFETGATTTPDGVPMAHLNHVMQDTKLIVRVVTPIFIPDNVEIALCKGLKFTFENFKITNFGVGSSSQNVLARSNVVIDAGNGDIETIPYESPTTTTTVAPMTTTTSI